MNYARLFSFISFWAMCGWLSTQTAAAQCDEAEHSTNWEDAWLSCDVSLCPNPTRGDVHWIMYDMGDVYSLYSSKIWNFNVSGETGKGVRNCWFDVSVDGQDWTEWGNMELPEAPGESDYIGVAGPDFEGLAARYLLIAVQNNWDGDPCSGFAEIRVEREFLGTDVEERELELELYPNPTVDFITIAHYLNRPLQLTIFNASGQIMESRTLSRSKSRIDVSQWSAGLYHAVLTDENGNSGSQRFVVMQR